MYLKHVFPIFVFHECHLLQNALLEVQGESALLEVQRCNAGATTGANESSAILSDTLRDKNFTAN